MKFSPDGTVLSAFGGRGGGDGQFNSPGELALDGAGNVYVSDFLNSRIQKFDPNGNFLFKFSFPGVGDRPFGPVGIKVDASGNIYVVDIRNNRVLKFDPNGNFLLQIGTPGFGDGQFDSPQFIALDDFGGIYVTDNHVDFVQKFGPDGKFIYKFGGNGSDRGQFSFSEGIAVSRAGRIYVDDIGNNRVTVFADDLKPDRDLNGIYDIADIDSDGDGIPDTVEVSARIPAEETERAEEDQEAFDSDLDGVTDNLHLDSDGDGICDITEAGLPDVDRDCLVDNPEDTNGNGLADIVEEELGGTPARLPDTDSHGTPDFLDGDADSDGVCDVIETEEGIDDNGDCIHDIEEDLDGDGLADVLHPIGGSPLTLTDSDGDGLFDHLDADSGGNGGCSLTAPGTGTATLLPLLFLPALILFRRFLRISKRD